MSQFCRKDALFANMDNINIIIDMATTSLVYVVMYETCGLCIEKRKSLVFL